MENIIFSSTLSMDEIEYINKLVEEKPKTRAILRD